MTSAAMTPSTHNAIGTLHHQKTKYTFDQPAEYHMTAATAAANANTRKHRSRHNRTNSEDADPTDGSGSLTYSAASSINSAGESTDSSFADIMKVLDMQDPQDLGPLLKDRGMTPAEYHMHLQHTQMAQPHLQNKQRSSQVSVASSLQYSTDGESNFLLGTDLVSTITGQPSDSLANDGGIYNNSGPEPFDDNDNILFAPAEPTDSLKKRKKEKKKQNKEATLASNKMGSSSASYPNNSGSQQMLASQQSLSTNATRQSGSTATVQHKNKREINSGSRQNYGYSPPPRIPRSHSMNSTVEDDICYAEWWMSCFPDAFKEMMPKR